MVKKKHLTSFKTLVVALMFLVIALFPKNVNAEEQVKIELTYIYVNDSGDNSLYVDTQYVPFGTTWGEFFETYEKAYENGTLTDSSENNAWEISVQNTSYTSTDQYYSNTIYDFNAYTGCALVTFYGYPANYEHGFFSFEYIVDGEYKDSGTGWDLLVPSEQAYGSDEAYKYVVENALIYSYIKDLINTPEATLSVGTIFTEEQLIGRWKGYNIKITVDTPPVSELFNDVVAGEWYEPYVQYVYEKGYMVGKSDTDFGVTGNLTRAEFATILYKIAGQPAFSTDGSFTDVKENDWYTNPVYWAAANGIANGYGNGLFGVSDSITREQLAMMLYKYSRGSVTDKTVLERFNDEDTISSYAVEAVTWAVENGIIAGTDEGNINPQNTATRAEAATMINKFTTLKFAQ